MSAENAVLSEEEWMDGNNILLVVSASWKNYWFTANINSLVLLSLLLFLFSSPPYHISIFPYCSPLSLLSVSVPLLLPHCPTHVYFDTQLPALAEAWPQTSAS